MGKDCLLTSSYLCRRYKHNHQKHNVAAVVYYDIDGDRNVLNHK